MDNPLPQASSLSYPDCRGWIIAFGVVEILLGLGCLLLASTVGLIFLREGSMAQMLAQPPLAAIVVAAGFYLLLAAFFFAGGIGSLRYKNWARILMVVASGIWLAFGALGVLMALILLPKITQTLPNAPPGGQHFVFAIAISMEIFLGILLPLAFLIFYTRKSVRAKFLARSAAEASAAPQAPSA
jgi:hypothetical protein